MLKVLIIDDSVFMINYIEKILNRFDCKVVGKAVNGLEGAEKYKKLHPDLVFLDINMPVMKGTDALKKIIEYDNEANVIICSSMGQDAYIIEALNIGAKDFIVKPFNEERIKEVLDLYFGKNKGQKKQTSR
jgi:two-component system chemotaxis response regulator CheY